MRHGRSKLRSGQKDLYIQNNIKETVWCNNRLNSVKLEKLTFGDFFMIFLF